MFSNYVQISVEHKHKVQMRNVFEKNHIEEVGGKYSNNVIHFSLAAHTVSCLDILDGNVSRAAERNEPFLPSFITLV